MSTRTCYHAFLLNHPAKGCSPAMASPVLPVQSSPSPQWLDVQNTLTERAQNIEKRVEINSSEQLAALRKKVRADKGL